MNVVDCFCSTNVNITLGCSNCLMVSGHTIPVPRFILVVLLFLGILFLKVILTERENRRKEVVK